MNGSTVGAGGAGSGGGAPRLAIVLVAVGVAFGLLLHAWPLQDPDEGRYTDIAHAMARGGDWFCARLNGLRYQEKPPFFFWLVAASLKLFGDNEVAARLPSTLASFATVALIGWFARQRFGTRAGGLAALLLAATPLFALLARFVLVDLTLTLFVTATTLCAHEAMGLGGPPGRTDGALRRGWACGAWLCAGLACLVKGPVGLALPIAGLALFLLVERRFRLLLKWFRPEGPALFALLVVPAYWLADRANPGFLHAFIVGENLGRLTSGEEFGRDHAFWYYVPIFAAGFLPWSLRLPAIARGLARDDDERRATRRFFACAVAGPFVLLSAVHSMLAYYLLPLAPTFALLAADALLREDDAAAAARAGRRLGAIGYGLFAALFALLVVAAAAGRFTTPERLLEIAPAAFTSRHDPEVVRLRVTTVHAALPWIAATLAPLVVALVVAAWRSARGQPLRAGVAAASGVVALTLLVPLSLGAGARVFTSQPIAAAIRPEQREGETVFLFDLHPRGLAFYLGHDVVLWSASLAEFGHVIPLAEAFGEPGQARGRALQKDRTALARLFSERPSLLVLLRGEDHLPDLAGAPGMRFHELWRSGDLILLRGERL